MNKPRHIIINWKKIKPGPSAFRQVFHVVSRKKSIFCEKICVNNTITFDKADIAEKFCEYYSSLYTEIAPEVAENNLDDRLSACLDLIPQHVYSFDHNFNSLENNDSYNFIKLEALKDIINKINNKKSTGLD